MNFSQVPKWPMDGLLLNVTHCSSGLLTLGYNKYTTNQSIEILHVIYFCNDSIDIIKMRANNI